MKFLNKKQKNNKGFSLVELIVVIAIMVVLVAVLAPVFSKYIESSRRSTDVSTAATVKTAVETALADENDVKNITFNAKTQATNALPSLKETPTARSDRNGEDAVFYYFVADKDSPVQVFIGDGTADVSTATGADLYKSADSDT